MVFFLLIERKKTQFYGIQIYIYIYLLLFGAAFWILAEIENITFCSLESIKYLN